MDQHMTRDEILEQLNRRILGHACNEIGYGHIAQDPYKSDFFKLFASAFERGMDIAMGDALLGALVERHPDDYAETGTPKNDTLQTVVRWFQEWGYAIEQYHPVSV